MEFTGVMHVCFFHGAGCLFVKRGKAFALNFGFC